MFFLTVFIATASTGPRMVLVTRLSVNRGPSCFNFRVLMGIGPSKFGTARHGQSYALQIPIVSPTLSSFLAEHEKGRILKSTANYFIQSTLTYLIKCANQQRRHLHFPL